MNGEYHASDDSAGTGDAGDAWARALAVDGGAIPNGWTVDPRTGAQHYYAGTTGGWYRARAVIMRVAPATKAH